MKRFLIIVFFVCASCVSMAQVDSILLKQEKLIKNEKTLQKGLDSLQLVLNATRNEYSKSNSDTVATEIIRLENQIYDVRSMLSKIGAQISQTDAELAKNNYFEDDQVEPLANIEYANLLKNSFFIQNVTPKELVAMQVDKDKELLKLSNDVSLLYQQVVDLKELFDKAQTQEEVNVIMQQAAQLKGQINELDKKIDALWRDVYNHKIDNYVVLLDKLGSVGRDNLELIDQLGREVIQNESVLSASLAPNLALMSYQKNLVLGYEKVLAQELKLKKSQDSLAKIVIAKPETRYEDVTFPYRSVVVYGDITIGNEYGYTSLDDVPTVKLPTTGLYYAVQVALVTGQVSSLSIFKGGAPLQQEIAGTKTRYILGGYRTYNEVAQGVKDCYKFGFKNPIAVAWVDGKTVSIQAAQAYQKANPVEAIASGGYKVDLYTENTDVASRLKAIVDIHAKGKIISRVASGDGYLYTVATFQMPEEAHVFAQIIKTDFPDVKVEVGSVEPSL